MKTLQDVWLGEAVAEESHLQLQEDLLSLKTRKADPAAAGCEPANRHDGLNVAWE